MANDLRIGNGPCVARGVSSQTGTVPGRGSQDGGAREEEGGSSAIRAATTMKKPESLFPDVHFGRVDQRIDWRSPQFADNTPDDDARPDSTPWDVVALLGFDPLELDDEEDAEEVRAARKRAVKGER